MSTQPSMSTLGRFSPSGIESSGKPAALEELDEPPRQITDAEKAGAAAALRIFASCPPPGGMVRWHGKAADLEPVVAAYHVSKGTFTGPKRFKRAAQTFLLTPDGQNASVGFYTRFAHSEASRCAFADAADAVPQPPTLARPPHRPAPPRAPILPHEYRGKSMQLVQVAGGTMTSEI